MIKANHHKGYHLFFKNYIRWIFNKHFHHIRFNKPAVKNDKPLVILANHISWWDGFFMYEINRRYIHKKIHVLMLEDELQNNPFLARIGAFSIRKNHRSIIESFHYMKKLNKSPENLIVAYPQGYIYSLYEPAFSFQKGITRWLKNLNDKPQIWLGAVLIDYSIRKKPGVEVYFKEYHDDMEHDLLEKAYNQHYQESVKIQKKLILNDNQTAR